eukprot:GHVQ01018810.1.p1 GENE.GHVQ01018810.1~~GHVQ01018810.1.p1  ORF type:complete len:197 (+),score=11.22 GHVQ01018810.1:594-1184(+)
MISVDHVGPREVRGSHCQYLVIIDHCTRYVSAHCVDTLTAEETVRVVRDHWVTKFCFPNAVLADNGRAFRGSMFQTFVTDECRGYVVYSGPAYPQGNGINEASHKALEASVEARLQREGDVSFNRVLQDAVMVYNATPHSAIGKSPYRCLFGMEFSFPRWQMIMDKTSEGAREAPCTRDFSANDAGCARGGCSPTC